MKLICAPMATLSHTAFRIMIEKFGGCDEYYTEMINAPSLLNGGPFEKYYIDSYPVPKKIVWQLTSKDSESMIKACEILCNLEGIGIDVNMGCSAPEIVKSGAGIAWMLKPCEQTKSLLKDLKSVLEHYEKSTKIHKRLSVKCRLGDENFSDESFFSFIDMLVECGVEQITIHPRTKKEKYREKPRYFYIEEVCKNFQKNKINVNVIANGDIFDENSFENVKKICPSCNGFMIGRAAVQKPWIFAELSKNWNGILRNQFIKDEEIFFQNQNFAENQNSTENQKTFCENKNFCETENSFENSTKICKNESFFSNQIDLLLLALDFICDVKKYQPQEFWKTRLQRFFTYFCNNFSFKHYIQSKLLNALTPEDLENLLKEYFLQVPEDRFYKIK